MSNRRKRRARSNRQHLLEGLRYDGKQFDETTPCTCPGGVHMRKHFVAGTCKRDHSAYYKYLLRRQRANFSDAITAEET